MKQRVSIQRCRDYDPARVLEAVSRAIEPLGGMERFVKPGERILLKPNLLSAKPVDAAATTHPAIVEALISLVSGAGAVPVVGDSPAMGGAAKVASRCGVMEVCTRTGTELVDLKTPTMVENKAGHTFKRLEIAREALDADGIINLPKLKTHAQMVLTLGVKNLFGCVPGKLKPQWHLSAGTDTSQFASMILDLYEFLAPRLTIVDGIVGMDGNGPASGDPVDIGLVFAASDCIALDTVIADVVGARPSDLPILKAATARGMPGTDLSRIDLAGERISDVRPATFRFTPVVSLNFAASLPYFIDTRLRKALTSRPHVDTSECVLCSVCVRHCPASVMEQTTRIVIDYDKCIRCYCCQEVCPEGAISSRDGWLKMIIPGL